MHTGCFPLGEPLDVDQPYSAPKLGWQVVQGPAELFSQLAVLDFFRRRPQRNPLREGRLEGSLVQVHAGRLGPPVSRAHPIEVRPGQDREQPGPRRRRVPDLIEVHEGAERGVLQQIFRVRHVTPAQPQRGPEQGIEVLGEDLFKNPRRGLGSRSLQRGGSFGGGSNEPCS